MKNTEKRDSTISEYYKKNFNDLVKKLTKRLGSEMAAEDAVQHAFTMALTYWDTFDSERPFEGWFTVVLRNSVSKHLNDQRNGGLVMEDSEGEEELVDLAHLDLPYEEILDAINNKRDSTKEILYLYFLRGLRPREISELLDVNNKAVRMCTYRFKKDMEDRFGDLRI